MRQRGLRARLIAVLAVGAFFLPTAAPLICEFTAGPSDMDHAAMEHTTGHGQAPTHAGYRLATAITAAACVSVAHCVATPIGFAVPRLVLESRADLLLASDTPVETFFLGRASAPPTPPPRA